MLESNVFSNILYMISPGTELRQGIDHILESGTGGLIVVAENEDALKIADGGFEINCAYNPKKLYELSKMDGAITLNADATKIINANVQLQPDPSIETEESGTRHRTAERVAKQTKCLIVSISQRRGKVTLYKDVYKYVLRETNEIMQEASQGIKTLERYKSELEKALTNLTIMEFDELVTIYEVLVAIQRYEMMFRINYHVKRNILELGVEGKLVSLQVEEIMIGMKDEMENLINDYISEDKYVDEVMDELDKLTQEELLEVENISFILGYGRNYTTLDKRIAPKGHRLLAKIVRLTKRDIEKLIETFKEFNNVMEASVDQLSEIKSISKFKARSIKNGLNRLRFMTMLEK